MKPSVLSSSGSRRAPGPLGTPLLGHSSAFRRDPPRFLLAAARAHGPVVRLRVGSGVYHLVSSPDLVEQVLQERAMNYLRDTRSSRSVRLVTGESLLTSEGATWRKHRRMAQPVFHQARLTQLADTMARAAFETAEAWDRAAAQGTPLDLASEMSRLTFTAVGRCLFGVDLGPRADDVETALPVLLDELFHRAQDPVTFPLWLPLARHRQFQRSLAMIDEVVAAIIRTRRGRPDPGTDMLGVLLTAGAAEGESLTDEELRNQVVTFLLAGHETTASTLTWAIALLAQHPSEQRAIARELDSSRVSRSQPLTAETVMPLRRTGAVLQETLRLYPAIWIAERRVIAADQLGGCAIPAGSSLLVSPYVTHRLPSLWPKPDAFHPERFLHAEQHSLAQHGYFPFGAGPHACIGQHFAMLEAKLILTTLLARFQVRLVEEPLPTAVGGITLRPAGAVMIHVERR